MSDDVLITPASRKIEFKDSGGTVDAVIKTDSSGNLEITNTGGDISIGDTSSDVIIGDGTNSIDLIFEQNGEIRGTSGVTITLGDSNTTLKTGADLTLQNNDIVFGTGTAHFGNVDVYTSGDNNHLHINAPAAIIGHSTTTANNASLGTSYYRWNGLFSSTGSFSGNVTLTSNSIHVATRSVLARDTNGLNLSTSNGTAAVAIDNSANATFNYNIYAAEYIYHKGDTNTYIRYETDRVTIVAGGTTKFDSSITYLNTGNFGTTANTVAQGNDSRIVNGQTAYTRTQDTRLGLDSHSLTNLNTQALWSQPAGYMTMVRASNSNGLPSSHGESYFGYNVTSRRDTGAGYSAFLTGYSGNKLWFTYNPTETNYPTWKQIFHDDYHPNADKWTTARTITLSGDLSGSVSLDGSANVTLSGQVSNDSHTHDGRYFTETESDARYLRKDEGNANWTRLGYGTSGTAYWHKLAEVTINGSYKDYQLRCDWTDRYNHGTLSIHIHSDNDNTADVWDAYVQQFGESNRKPNSHFKYYKSGSTVQVWIYTLGWREWDYIRRDAVTEGTPTINWYKEGDSGVGKTTTEPSGLTEFSDYTPHHPNNLGNANNADTVDNLHAASFLRSDANDTATGVITINNTNDAQLKLTSPSTWTGIGFDDSASAGASYIWHYGATDTYSIGGGGSSSNSNKRLHVEGGASIGAAVKNLAGPDNGLILSGNISIGKAGNGTNVNGRTIALEGAADGAGEGSGRIFFSEHNSTTGSMDNYGMSLGYRGGPTTIAGTSGNNWTGLSQIANGEWGMFGHNNDATGALIMSGDRAATWISFEGNDLRLSADANTVLKEGDGNGVRIQTNHGWMNLGPQNTSHCHLTTDRSNFWFSKQIIVDGGVIGSYDEDLYLRRASSSTNQIQIASGQIYASQPLEIKHEGGNNATNGGRFLSASYNGSNRLGVFSSQYSTGHLLIGNGMSYDSGANQIVSTFSNFSDSRTGFKVSRGGVSFLGTTGAVQTAVDSAITTQDTFFHQTTDGFTRIGTPTGTQNSLVEIRKADNNVSDHIRFYLGSTRMGEIGAQDTSWLRINQVTSKNIYTPRVFRADGGLQSKDGSDAAPAFTFHSDQNTGMFQYADDTIGFTAGGTRRARFGSSIFLEADDVRINQYLYHNGDTDTYIRYTGDRIRVVAGGLTFMDIVEGGTDYLRFNQRGVTIGSNTSPQATLTVDQSCTETPANGCGTGRDAHLKLENTNTTGSASTCIIFNAKDSGGNMRHGAGIQFKKAIAWSANGQYPGELYFWTRPTSGNQAAAQKLDKDGNAIFKGNVTAFGSLSDRRLKQDIQIIPNALSKVVDGLNGVTFEYKKNGTRSTGLFAQDLEKVLPEAVYTSSDIETGEEQKAIHYGNVVGLLVEAIKELKQEIEDLKNGDNED